MSEWLPLRNWDLDRAIVEIETEILTGVRPLDFHTRAPNPNMDYNTGGKWTEAYKDYWVEQIDHSPKTPLEQANYVFQSIGLGFTYYTPALILFYIVTRS